MSSSLDSTAAASYHDFSALAALKSQAKGNGTAAMRGAAQQFEAMFLQELMKTMRDAVPKAELFESQAMDMFQGMFDKEVSVQMARRGSVGMADMLVKQMGKFAAPPAADGAAAADPAASPPPSTLDVLQQGREAAGGMPLQRAGSARALPLHPDAQAPAYGLQRPGPLPLEAGVPRRGRAGTAADGGTAP